MDNIIDKLMFTNHFIVDEGFILAGDPPLNAADFGTMVHQEIAEYLSQLKEPEQTPFKCQANHRDKGHVKPFYRRGRW